MAEYPGFTAVVTRGGYSDLFRWVSVGDIVQALPPMQVDGVPWMATPEEYTEYLWFLTYSDRGAWAVHPTRAEAGFYYAPYNTGVFSLVDSANARRVAALPGCLLDVGPTDDTTVKVISPAGVLVTQDIAPLLPAGYTSARVDRALYCVEGPAAGNIALAILVTLGGTACFVYTDFVAVGSSFTANNGYLFRRGVYGSLSAEFRDYHTAAAVPGGNEAVAVVGFSTNAELSTPNPVISCPDGLLLGLRQLGPAFDALFIEYDLEYLIYPTTSVGGYDTLLVDFSSETELGYTEIPVTTSDFVSPTGVLSEEYIFSFLTWAEPTVVRPFWTDTVGSSEYV